MNVMDNIVKTGNNNPGSNSVDNNSNPVSTLGDCDKKEIWIYQLYHLNYKIL